MHMGAHEDLHGGLSCRTFCAELDVVAEAMDNLPVHTLYHDRVPSRPLEAHEARARFTGEARRGGPLHVVVVQKVAAPVRCLVVV